MIGKHINQHMSRKKELCITIKWEENQSGHIHKEVKERVKSGDAGERLKKNGDISELNNSEIRISKR
jgi:hypothetical protein